MLATPCELYPVLIWFSLHPHDALLQLVDLLLSLDVVFIFMHYAIGYASILLATVVARLLNFDVFGDLD